LVARIAPFRSVVDFGVGRGSWLQAAMKAGVTDIRGYDIPEISVSERKFPEEAFFAADLSAPIEIERTFDLVISTEVAEHIPAPSAGVFLANLANAGNLILFSAAPPYQGGAGHVNENWVEYWAKFFFDLNFECFDCLREPLWHEGRVRSYYRQNIFLFAHGEICERFAEKGIAPTTRPLSLIHPEQYLKAVNRPLPPQAKRLSDDVKHYYDCVTKPPAVVDAAPRHYYGNDHVGWGFIRGFQPKE